MNNRDKALQNIRPQIPNIITDEGMTEVERFQNTTLRPILKLQNDLIKVMVFHAINSRKNKYQELIEVEKVRYIDKHIMSDNKLKQRFIGAVIGMMTTVEYQLYTKKESEYRRRIMTMLRERIISNI